MAKKSKKSVSRAKSKSNAPAKRQMSFDEIEEKLTANILKSILALYLLKNSRIPMSNLVDDLFDMEIEVGRFIAEALQGSAKPLSKNLKGLLASALSFIPLQSDKGLPKTSTPKQILK